MIPFIAFCQNFDELKVKYKKEKKIILNLDKKLIIKKNGKNLSITEQDIEEIFYIQKPRDVNKQTSVYFDSFKKITSSYVEVDNRYSKPEHLKKSQYLKKNFSFSDSHYLSRGIFYSDGQLRNINFSNLYKNTITRKVSSFKYKDPHFLSRFSLIRHHNIINSKYIVEVDNGIEIDFKKFNLPEHHFKIDSTKSKIIYTWTFKNTPKIKSISNFSPNYYGPQIYPLIKSYNHGSSTIKILGSTDNLYHWYNSLLAKTPIENEKFLKNLSREIIGDETDAIEITKKIYYHVQKKINYIAFEDGMNGFIPRDPYKVYQNKYGDCKDMSYLLYTLLRYANINSHVTWIGTRSRPFTYKSLPSPSVDNHMICSVDINDKTYFLDATANFLQLDYPSTFIQGKEALIGISNNQYKILKVPTVSSEKNYLKIDSKLKLTDGKLGGTIEFKSTGLDKLKRLHNLNRYDTSDSKKINKAYNIASIQVELENSNTENNEITKDTLSTTSLIKLKRGVRKIGNDYYIKPIFDIDNLNLIESDESYGEKIDYKFLKEISTSIEIPEGYEVTNIPSNITIGNKDYVYTILFNYSNHVLYIDKTLKINTLNVLQNAIGEWNKFVKKTIKTNKLNLKIAKKTI